MNAFIGFTSLIVTVLLFITAGYFYVQEIKAPPLSYLCMVVCYALYAVPNALTLINK